MARRILLIVGLGLLGVLAAASIGYASYLVSRDSVGLPVTKLDPAPRELAPPPARTASTRTATVEDRQRGRTTSTEDHRGTVETGEDSSGRGRGRSGGDDSGSGNSGSGSGSSGKGSGGGGDLDDD